MESGSESATYNTQSNQCGILHRHTRPARMNTSFSEPIHPSIRLAREDDFCPVQLLPEFF